MGNSAPSVEINIYEWPFLKETSIYIRFRAVHVEVIVQTKLAYFYLYNTLGVTVVWQAKIVSLLERLSWLWNYLKLRIYIIL